MVFHLNIDNNSNSNNSQLELNINNNTSLKTIKKGEKKLLRGKKEEPELKSIF